MCSYSENRRFSKTSQECEEVRTVCMSERAIQLCRPVERTGMSGLRYNNHEGGNWSLQFATLCAVNGQHVSVPWNICYRKINRNTVELYVVVWQLLTHMLFSNTCCQAGACGRCPWPEWYACASWQQVSHFWTTKCRFSLNFVAGRYKSHRIRTNVSYAQST